MSSNLNNFDYAVIGFYLLALLAIGWVLKRRASGSLEEYIVAGRRMPWWALGFSGMASMLDMAGTAIIVAFLFLIGPRGLFIEFRGGACLILAMMMLWMGKWHRRSGCLTAADWMVFRFGTGFGGQFARLAAVLAAVLSTIGMLAMLVFGAGQFLSIFLPLSPNVCALILLTIATFYAAFSGFYGVVVTDIFQGVFILGATIYVVLSAWSIAPDSASLAAMAEQVTGNLSWSSGSPTWSTEMPTQFAAYEYLMLFAGLYLLRQLIGGMAAGDDPKYFGARNDRECGTLTFMWTSLMTTRWPLMMGIAILGLSLASELLPAEEARLSAAEQIRNANPEVNQAGWETLVSQIANDPESQDAALIGSLQDTLGAEYFSQKTKLLGMTGEINAEKILPAVLLMKIPAGMRGLLLIALISAFMSTFDSHLNRATGMVVHDFYRAYLRPSASSPELIYASWLAAILMVVLSVLFALTIESINDIWSWIVMGLTAGLLGPSVLRFYWWRFTGIGFAVGTICGMLAAVVQRLFAPDMNEFLVFVLVMAAGTSGSLIGSLMSKPVDDKILWAFYDKTRPFGLWRPLFEKLSNSEQKKVASEHYYDLLATPFALLWQVSMFMLSMLVLIQNWSGVFVWTCLFAIGLVGLYYTWYCRLPAANWYETSLSESPSISHNNNLGSLPSRDASFIPKPDLT